MTFNSVFIFLGLHIIANLIMMRKGWVTRIQGGCLIWSVFVILHMLNAFFISPWLFALISTPEEMVDAQWAQTPGMTNPLTLFLIGFLGSIVIQMVFNSGIKKDPNDMPDTYGN